MRIACRDRTLNVFLACAIRGCREEGSDGGTIFRDFFKLTGRAELIPWPENRAAAVARALDRQAWRDATKNLAPLGLQKPQQPGSAVNPGLGLANGALFNDCDLAAGDVEAIASEKYHCNSNSSNVEGVEGAEAIASGKASVTVIVTVWKVLKVYAFVAARSSPRVRGSCANPSGVCVNVHGWMGWQRGARGCCALPLRGAPQAALARQVLSCRMDGGRMVDECMKNQSKGSATCGTGWWAPARGGKMEVGALHGRGWMVGNCERADDGVGSGDESGDKQRRVEAACKLAEPQASWRCQPTSSKEHARAPAFDRPTGGLGGSSPSTALEAHVGGGTGGMREGRR
eukprot:358314-Chlamydomonas_euryale.AAC.2